MKQPFFILIYQHHYNEVEGLHKYIFRINGLFFKSKKFFYKKAYTKSSFLFILYYNKGTNNKLY
jgi:hypothetical protein